MNPPNFDASAAEVSGDNQISITDALIVAQFYVGLIAKLPGCSTPQTPPPVGQKGYISINDPVPGWASMSGGTTGGGTDLSKAVTVSSMGDLKSAASGSDKKIILVKPGNYNGALEPGANKTIIGTAPGVMIKGYIKISGSDKSNIIIRNLAVRGENCSGSGCKSGDDGVYIGKGAHHVWFDHVDISDGQDGNLMSLEPAISSLLRGPNSTTPTIRNTGFRISLPVAIASRKARASSKSPT